MIVGVDLINESLVDIFLNIIKNYDEKNKDSNNYFNKIGVQINNETIDLVHKMISKTPTLLNEIENVILEVIKDNKIDASDIPKFILIVQILYERIFNQKEFQLDTKKRTEFCATILKFIVHTLIEERKIIIEDENKKVFLIQLDNLIDSCMNLLSFSHVLENPKECCAIM